MNEHADHAPQVTLRTPRAGRVSMWVGFACISIGALIFVAWGVPALRSISEQNARSIAESNCRSRILEQLDAANALLLVRTTAAVHPNPLPEGQDRSVLIGSMDAMASIVEQLGVLRGQSTVICRNDPNYHIPKELIP